MRMNRIGSAVAVAALWMSSASAEIASLDGQDVYWIAEGEGPAIVFVHGWTCDTTAWTEQLAAFSENYRVIALDLPGHGLSDPSPDGQYTMDHYADAVEAVRVAAGVDDIMLVGHSMGAPVISTYALNYPDHVEGIIAVDGGIVPPQQAQQFPQMPPDEFGVFRETVIRGFFVEATTPQIQDRVLHMMLSPSNERASAVGSSMGSFVADGEGQLEVPALVVLAGTATPPDADALGNFAPLAEVEVMPNTGHFLMMEQPAAFNALMAGFLDANDF